MIAAAVVVTSVATISAQDQTANIDQIAFQDSNNAISGTTPNIAWNSSNNQAINSTNIQAQSAVAVQTGDIVAAGGNIVGSNITKGSVGNQTPNQTADIGQFASQSNNNSIASPADRATITADVIDVRGWIHIENLSIQLPNVAVDSSNDQTIDSTNVQAQSAVAVQTGDIVAAVDDIDDSNIYDGPIVAANTNSEGDGAGPAGPTTPPAAAGPAARP